MRRTVEHRSLPGWRSSSAPAACAPQSLSSGRRSPIRSPPYARGNNLARMLHEGLGSSFWRVVWLSSERFREVGRRLMVRRVGLEQTQPSRPRMARDPEQALAGNPRHPPRGFRRRPAPAQLKPVLRPHQRRQPPRNHGRHPLPGAPSDWKPPPPLPDVLTRLLADKPLPR